MINYNGKVISEKDYNDKISGVKSNYSFFGLGKAYAKEGLIGENLICVSSYLINPNERKYDSVGYYNNISEFLKSDSSDWFGIHHMFFKSMDNEKQALDIIKDIKDKHNLL